MNGPDSKIDVLPHSGHFLAVRRTLCEIRGFPSFRFMPPTDRLRCSPRPNMHPLLLIVEVAAFIDEIKILTSEVDGGPRSMMHESVSYLRPLLRSRNLSRLTTSQEPPYMNPQSYGFSR